MQGEEQRPGGELYLVTQTTSGRWERFLFTQLKCETCGSAQHLTQYCVYAICEECKRAGHTRSICPRLRCRHCGQQGHQRDQCSRHTAGLAKVKYPAAIPFSREYLSLLEAVELERKVNTWRIVRGKRERYATH